MPKPMTASLPAAAGFRRHRCVHRHTPAGNGAPAYDYLVETATRPVNRSVEISGPGEGIRWRRLGAPDFSSFAELAKSIVSPDMGDMEKAMAVYRFSARHACLAGMGWGGTEMTRFLNCFGYSFCWGQADFQHLLYEAAGLRARAPGLKGHSSVEVLVNGQWRMLDAFMQLALPAPELDGLATGRDLVQNPWIFDAARSVPERLKILRDYWSRWAGTDLYQPWQDSRSMVLSLRRHESLRFDYGRREAWCVAPGEPPDYVNGEWRWTPPLDVRHLEAEVQSAANLKAAKAGVTAAGPGPASVEYRLRSSYPFCTGRLGVTVAGAGGIRILVSNNCRQTWSELGAAAAGTQEFVLDPHLSARTLPNLGKATSRDLDRAVVSDLLVRLEFAGRCSLRGLDFSLLVQANAASLPAMQAGLNQWQFLCNEPEAAISHCWDEYPEFTVSDPAPFEGDQVELALTVHNPGPKACRRLPVEFLLAGTGVSIGTVLISRIPPGGQAVARMSWTAAMVPDRANTGRGGEPGRYVFTALEARVGAETAAGDLSGVARAQLSVRPRPLPKLDSRLVWSSQGRFAHEGRLVLRTAVVNEVCRDLDLRLNYLPDSPLETTLVPFLGDPDAGGKPLAAPARLAGVQPGEFGVAEWVLETAALPAEFDLWIEALSAAPVPSERRRLLVRRRVCLKETPLPVMPPLEVEALPRPAAQARRVSARHAPEPQPASEAACKRYRQFKCNALQDQP
jgi:hypothetical protein